MGLDVEVGGWAWQRAGGAEVPPREPRDAGGEGGGLCAEGKFTRLTSPLPLSPLGDGDSLYTDAGPGNDRLEAEPVHVEEKVLGGVHESEPAGGQVGGRAGTLVT